MSTVGEDFEPLVEGGLLFTEQDVPTFKEAEAALLGRGVVAAGGGQDGPVQLVGDPLVLQLPDVGAGGGPLLLLVVYVAVVPGNPLFGGVDGDACVVLLFGGGLRDWVGRGWPWRCRQHLLSSTCCPRDRGGRAPCSCTSHLALGSAPACCP